MHKKQNKFSGVKNRPRDLPNRMQKPYSVCWKRDGPDCGFVVFLKYY